MSSGDEVARLVIYGVTPDDSGAYSISVSNAFGQASDVINVNIVGKRHGCSLVKLKGRASICGQLDNIVWHALTRDQTVLHCIHTFICQWN